MLILEHLVTKHATQHTLEWSILWIDDGKVVMGIDFPDKLFDLAVDMRFRAGSKIMWREYIDNLIAQDDYIFIVHIQSSFEGVNYIVHIDGTEHTLVSPLISWEEWDAM